MTTTNEAKVEVNPMSKAALATTAKDIKTLGAVLEARKGEFAKLLPSHLSAEKLLKVAINCIAKTPELQNCSVESVLRCVYASAELGLELGGALGYAYMLPFDGVATFVIGYRGLLKLVNNSGEVSSVRAVVVRKKDKFHYTEGLTQRIVHEPFLDGDAGELVRVYSVATMRDGTKTAEFMTKAQVDAIKARSRTGAKNKGPWVTDYERMACKTVVRRHCNYLPLADEHRAFLDKDEDVVDGEVTARDGAPTETAEKKARRRLNLIDVPSEEVQPEIAATSQTAPVQDDLTEKLTQSLQQAGK